MLLVPIALRPSKIHGTGVFSTAHVPNQTRVWQFDRAVDQRYPMSEFKKLPAHVQKHIEKFGVFGLDGRYFYIWGDHTFLINHSNTPNLVPRDEILVHGEGVVVATRDIEPGEELTIDYTLIDAHERDKVLQGRGLFPEQKAHPG